MYELFHILCKLFLLFIANPPMFSHFSPPFANTTFFCPHFPPNIHGFPYSHPAFFLIIISQHLLMFVICKDTNLKAIHNTCFTH